MITFMILEIFSLTIFLLFFLLIINVFLRLFFINRYQKFKKRNKSIVIWIFSITLLLILLRLPLIIELQTRR
jgi:hypothetical protein